MADQSLPAEERLELATQDYRSAVFTSIRQAAAAYGLNHATLANRLNGRGSRRTAQTVNRKLFLAKELALEEWILSMDKRRITPSILYTHQMVNLLLEQRGGQPVGLN
ncbi:hypothetical protein GQ53DRAFT_862840 [Thozetella sp. PMI_491]|nr:hypothetical protein GQ53DRAFT_862840 [Thozetella sp. PMI_491]